MNRWKPLIVLGTAQFLMVLDASVMNVSISQLVADFHTEVTTIQAVITLYTLVMAAFMLTGGKIGDMIGRRRVFVIGLIVYGIGSGLTALAPTVGVLALGWSVIEGLGAALVLPALAALAAGSYRGRERAVAYGVIGGLAGAGIAVGPLLGGWVTTYLTWRLVFAGEVLLVVAILAVMRWIPPQPAPADRPALDVLGAALSAAGLALVVLAVLQSGSWGWVQPRNPPFTVLGFAPTLFAVGLGAAVLYLFCVHERHRERRGGTPLVSLDLFGNRPLRSGLVTLFNQNTVLLGLFFVIPLYLQVVQGLDAFQTGLRLLPVSATMLATSMCGSLLLRFASARTIVRIGLLVLLAATLWLITAIGPQLEGGAFAGSMALLGIGLGLLASQLGNTVQSSVRTEERSEAGGLQYTAQNLGSSLGTALIGALLIGALAASVTAKIESDPRVSAAVAQEVGTHVSAGISFVPADQVSAALAARSDVPPQEAAALVEHYRDAQIQGLKSAVLACTVITGGALLFTRHLPAERAAPRPPE
ncbi:MFS transporter [Kitasatospora cheerisanensis]|uniref:Transmembrane transport protein n=1 Tax=Kitasatospora cheerisanensis KCTC 2395 TaxID=1348663 RepID=A0A066YGU7_9ACTN|nr:MFS transporter [Kitasatospora cheerisanensis]KDN80678.1 transmembrane transport protein [Kitasatospora cheerisanensis KCTC 2395]